MIYARTSNGDKIANVNKKMNDWTQITINDISVTNGTVQLGIYSDANAGNWLMVDDITFIGDGSGTQPVVTEPDHLGSQTGLKLILLSLMTATR